MDWTDLQLEVATADLDTAAAVAQMTVPYGIQIEDYSDLLEMVPQIAHIDLIDEALLERNKNVGIIHIYISADQNPAETAAFVSQRLAAEDICHTIYTGRLREEDWATAWKSYYHPVKVGERLVVCPTWEQYDPAPGELVIRLDPGMAFGTGTHHTTRLCIRLLERAVTPGCAMLDMGTGSGILSIAALLLGARRAVGVDLDPVAVRTAAENARLGGFDQDRFAALAGDLTRDDTLPARLGGPFQVIAANIVADVIIALAPRIRRLLAPDGVLVASGIILPRRDEVTAALEAQGLFAVEVLEQDGWCALYCTVKERA